jgi:hypothetical protein
MDLTTLRRFTAGRTAGLRSVVDSNSLRAAELRPAFVLMQYFGCLRDLYEINNAESVG